MSPIVEERLYTCHQELHRVHPQSCCLHVFASGVPLRSVYVDTLQECQGFSPFVGPNPSC